MACQEFRVGTVYRALTIVDMGVQMYLNEPRMCRIV